jgi:hypothetical protein
MRKTGSSAVSTWVVIDGGENRRRIISAVTISRERNAYNRVISLPPVKNYVHQPAHHTSSPASIEDKPPRSDEFIRQEPRSGEFIRHYAGEAFTLIVSSS